MNAFSALFSLCLFAVSLRAAASAVSDTVAITIFATGETHAMLDPCDCPQEPGGGFAQRATVLSAAPGRRNGLLLDAGGFAGGGMYDAFTVGRAADSQRTVSAIAAMAAMGYDAVAVGDDELQYGARWLSTKADSAGLPLVSANCFLPGNKRYVPAFRVIERNGIRFGVTALTTPERLLVTDTEVAVAPPVRALREIWQELIVASDFQILLSHLGEEWIPEILDSFPGIDLIVNGHRKTSNAPVQVRDSTVVMQFGFQGKKLSRAVVAIASKGGTPLRLQSADWMPVLQGTRADQRVAAVLASPTTLARRPVFDLYIMSQCEYGRVALREFLDFVRRVPETEWNLWFIGDIRGDALVSLHGDDEVREEMAWLAVGALYPGKWPAFLAAACAGGEAPAVTLRSLGIDSTSLRQWIYKNGRKALEDHYRRSERLGITASPTLRINNAPFEKEITAPRLMKHHCASFAGAFPWCDSLPRCFDNSDCIKKGHIGECAASGTCTFLRDRVFVFRVLVADATMQSPEKAIIATTEGLFPAARIETVRQGSVQGRAMMKTFAPSALPFYFFGANVRAARNFPKIEKGLVPVKDGYTFTAGITPVNFFCNRTPAHHRCEALLDPLFVDAVAVAASISADTAVAGRIRILPAIFGDPTVDATDIGEKVRREEALRWLVLDSLYRDAYPRYLAASQGNPGSTVGWLDALETAGIDRLTFLRQLKVSEELLQAHWRGIEPLAIKDPISFMVGNRELIPVRNQAELPGVLEYCKRKRKEP